ncbi:hypothetical protein GCM10010497_52730 [Streptomyces cinereoruber]|uniref:DUF4349 domain-containing protein n=1 Tax=Streptomyces cinereoruber TaxID=67260 RepID=A0AAV4KNL7_9ACTN|nr:DUF4349 domain-containing protein [Streptomyces cinereoruber]MBB4160991.1 hypothetical protein [Streptomyces cinereoruber]MBY8818769.1 DUF4349 domain-containing protein [Streptomyces cinereoruber]NIH62457.1 hypothetical protein [Streptomyces cinereoruber]QEV35302.1 DUF4349 domain-containing protein [Streptomyces cinereoruber]GGR42814.1 hypothetical protein GCM10010497_52730 [Streptomyces cinereoruber]
MRRTSTTAAVLLTASLVLTGCGAGGSDVGDRAAGARAERPADRAPGGGAADGSSGASSGSGPGSGSDAGSGSGSGSGKAAAKAPAQQHVIRTASLSVEVADAAKALATARTVAVDAGGRVEDESTERMDDTSLASRIVLRVPQGKYDSVLAELAGTGKLLNRKADAQDVTDQVVDVQSRIATQRASVARVRELMDRADKLSDVVTLEAELSRRQADLEALLAQQSSLKDRTSLATITLQLTEKRKEEPKDEEPKEEGRPGFLDALSGGWNALVGVAAWVLVVLAALAPWLAVGLAAFLLWSRLIRPRLAARRPAPVPGPRPGDAGVERNAAGAPVAPQAPETGGAPEK